MAAGSSRAELDALVDAASALVRSAPLGLAIVDRDLHFVFVNDALARLLGVPVEVHVGQLVGARVPDLSGLIRERINHVFETGDQVVDLHLPVRPPSGEGEPRHFTANLFPLHAHDGGVVAVGATVHEITEQQVLRSQLSASESRYQHLAASGVIGVIEGEGEHITAANSAFLAMLGLDDDALISGLSWVELTPPDWSPSDEAAVKSLEATGAAPAFEKEYWHADGTRVPVMLGGVLTDPARFRWVFFVADLSARRELEESRASEQQRTQERRLRSALEGMLDAVVIAEAIRDRSGRIVDFLITYANEGSLHTAVRTPQVGRRFSEQWPELMGGTTFQAFVRVADLGERVAIPSFHHVYELDGERVDRWYDMHAVPISGGPDGDGDGYLVAYRDVTERAHHEQELRQTQERLQQAQRIARLGSWMWDATTGLMEWSEELNDLYGPPLTGPVPRGAAFGAIHPEDRDSLRDVMARVSEGVRSFRLMQRMVRADGDVRSTIVHGEVDVDEDGTLLAIRGTTQDITDQRRAEEALRESRARLEAERRVVEVLQRAIVPEQPRTVPGLEVAAAYHPAGERAQVGGDWYDALPLPDGRILLAVGDVAGHGLEASTLMVRMRSAMRAYAVDDPEPARVLDRLDILLSVEEPGAFVTAIVALVDPATGAVTWARAGHPPPVGLSGGRARILDVPGGTPLGVRLGSGYTTSQWTLEPGAVLLLFSDGLVEHRGLAIDDGFAGVLAALDAAPTPLGALVRHLVELARAPGDADDDLCVLACARLRPAAD